MSVVGFEVPTIFEHHDAYVLRGILELLEFLTNSSNVEVVLCKAVVQ